MGLLDTEVFDPKTGKSKIEIKTDISVEEHIKMKLADVGGDLNSDIKALDLNDNDFQKYSFNKPSLSVEKIVRLEQAKVLQNKHASIKVAIKECTTHEELNGLSWNDFEVEG